MEINLKNFPTKESLLSLFANTFEEMHSKNYDALIDVLTSLNYELTIKFTNKNHYLDITNLIEIFDIISIENPKIKCYWI